MREYTKLAPSFWINDAGKKIRRLGYEAQLMALYLTSCPHATMLGIYYLPIPLISHETGIPFEGASKALRSLHEIGFCHYDPHSEYVWIYDMVELQVGNSLKLNDNRIKSIKQAYANLPNLPFLKDFFDKYQDMFHLVEPRENTSPFEGASKALRSQEQEQEQEQEKEQENEQEQEQEKYYQRRAAKSSSTITLKTDVDQNSADVSTNPLADPDASVITITLNDKSEFPITSQMLKEWQLLYQAVDVMQELRNIRGWNNSNPKRRKTKSGILNHITQWLAKAQNTGGVSTPVSVTKNFADQVNQRNLQVVSDWLSDDSGSVVDDKTDKYELSQLDHT